MMGIEQKIYNISDLVTQREIWKSEGKKVVITNGCFDILHAGHVLYLEKAKSLGDILIVLANSDESVRRLKGENRPFNDEFSRTNVLAALSSIDGVLIFTEDTPEQVIRIIKPNILVKGKDYEIDEIAGGEFVLASGGKVMTISLIKGYSTSNIIHKIKDDADKRVD